MRIIAGKHRGRVLKEFPGTNIRPTSDRAREALFNIYAALIPNSTVLDMFAGSGAVGIEAISRGAKEVVFTDVDKESINLIKSNLLLIKENATVIFKDGIEYAKSCAKKFDFIFIDPPYKTDLGVKALKTVGSLGLLNKGGVAVFESDKECNEDIEGLKKVSSRRYGKNCFNIYENAREENTDGVH